MEQAQPVAEPTNAATTLIPQFEDDVTETSWAGAPIEPADEDLDLLAGSNRRPSRLTVFLIAGILAVVAFGGGVLVQKHYGATTVAAGRAGAGAAAGGFGQGFPGGAEGGTGGTGTGTRAGGATAGGSAAAGSGAAATPSVVGTVVKISGTTVTVKNFAGKTITVKVPAGTAVSLSSSLSLTGLKSGTTVSVVGTTAADGSVTASAVTARK